MGQQRTDTANQLKAKRDGAIARKCPNCNRKNALSDMSTEFQNAKQCRYCGYARGYIFCLRENFEEWPDAR